MINKSRFRRIFLKNLKSELPDSLDQVIFILFVGSLAVSLIKLLIAFPLYLDNPFIIPIVSLAIVFCFVLFYILYKSPKHLLILTKWGLIWMAAYILLIIFLSPDRMNFVSIQHMFIVIMLAFYGINRFWGIAFSGVFVLTVMAYMFGIKVGKFNLTLFPESFPFYSSFIIVLLNFVQIVFIHFLYNRTLTNTVRDIRELNKQLEDLVSAKSNFLSTMSHELRTPLNSVIGTAYLLIESDMDESQRKNIQNLRFSAESLLVLINDILDFSKMDSKYIQLESIPFYPGEVIDNVFEGMQQKASEKSLNMFLDIKKPAQSIKVIGDPARLTQIIFNILGNAIKFTPIGKVSVGLDLVKQNEHDVMLIVEVEDTGIGIDPAMQDKIFEPFTQASTSTNRQFGGTGLGLTIVKHLVNLHKGEILLTSQLGQGTRFRLELPYKLHLGEMPIDLETKRNQKLIQDKSFAGMKLLLAEDNQMSVLFMKQLLAKWDLEPEIAFDGEEAIEFFRQGRQFDVILMDIHMPRVNGLEAVEFIRHWERENGGRAHIIALTASVSDKIISELNTYGFDDYLGKPFNPNDLQHKLEVAEERKTTE